MGIVALLALRTEGEQNYLFSYMYTTAFGESSLRRKQASPCAVESRSGGGREGEGPRATRSLEGVEEEGWNGEGEG